MDSASINTVDSQGSTVTSSEAMNIPKRINLPESGLRRSPRLKEKAVISGVKQKAHVIFGPKITKVILLFILFSIVKDLAPCMTSYEPNPNESFTTRAMHRFHELFITAIQKEIFDHESRNHWTIVHRSTLPLATKTIQAIWSFKRKRFPDSRLNKHKACICAHGGMED